MGLDEDSGEVSTSVGRSSIDTHNRHSVVNSERDELLSISASAKYRGLVARMSYIGQDRCDIQAAVKEPRKGNEFS